MSYADRQNKVGTSLRIEHSTGKDLGHALSDCRPRLDRAARRRQLLPEPDHNSRYRRREKHLRADANRPRQPLLGMHPAVEALQRI